MKRFYSWIILVLILLVSSSCLTVRKTGDPIQSKKLPNIVKLSEIGKGLFAKCWSITLFNNVIMVGDYHRSTVHIFDWIKNTHIGQFGSNRDISKYDTPWWEKVPADRSINDRLPLDLKKELAEHITFRPASIYLKPDGILVMADDFVDLYLQDNEFDNPAIRLFAPGFDQLTGKYQPGFLKNLHEKVGKPLSITYNSYSDRFVMAEEIGNSVATMTVEGKDFKYTTEKIPAFSSTMISHYSSLVKTKEPVTNLDIARNMGDGAGEFRLPISVASYRDQMYVADYGNNRIQIFNLQGKHVANLEGRDGIYTWFEKPLAVDVDTTGGIYVLTSKNIVIFSPSLKCLGTFGQGDLIDPHQLVVYTSNDSIDVLVTDSGVNAVLRFGLKEGSLPVNKNVRKSKSNQSVL